MLCMVCVVVDNAFCVSLVLLFWHFFFFFKQKTAYEVRISDWSSDVCSSDLLFAGALDALRTLNDDGFRLAIATGKSRRGLDRSLAHHADVRDLIVASRTADETASKPDPLMLRELLDRKRVV